MATYTTAQMRASGIYPAATDIPGSPGQIMLEYVIDGSKKAIATNDVVTMFDIPTYTGFLVEAASVNVTNAATASCALSIGIAGTDVTGLTAFDATSTAGAQVKLATGANSVITTSGTSSITLKANTAGLGNGVVRVRVFGKLLG
jgi:hypothetical protein